MSMPSSKANTEQPGTGEWESEGGSMKPDPVAQLPEGIIAVSSVQYRVGPYSYARLEDAVAELVANQPNKEVPPCAGENSV